MNIHGVGEIVKKRLGETYLFWPFLIFSICRTGLGREQALSR
jgi:hypothetical protein